MLPGDRLELALTKEQRRLGMWKFKGRATVDGQLVAEAVIGAKIMGL